MVVAAGRSRHLPAIARAVGALAASASGRQVAEVRSAIALSEDQVTRLSAALREATGSDVDVQVVVDPTVLGGIVTHIGDTVIDGTVRNRLNKMREAFA
jgi:F-type H+-transporting ATPase subunit delta